MKQHLEDRERDDLQAEAVLILLGTSTSNHNDVTGRTSRYGQHSKN